MGACHGGFSKKAMSMLRPECVRSLVEKSYREENGTGQDCEWKRVWCVEDRGVNGEQ